MNLPSLWLRIDSLSTHLWHGPLKRHILVSLRDGVLTGGTLVLGQYGASVLPGARLDSAGSDSNGSLPDEEDG
jgi:hypothetical protein